MNKKTLVIKYCDHCPYFDNKYYTYLEECSLINKSVVMDDNQYPIPDWCPLGKVTQVGDYEKEHCQL